MTFARSLPFALLLVACSRTDPPADKAAAPASATAAASSSPPAGSAAAPAASGASPAADAGPTTTWKGAFKAKPGSVDLDKEAAAAIKVWSKDPGTALVGDGTATLTVSGGGARRVVRGEIDGALGPLVVNGEIDGNALRARVDPKDPNAAEAMTGVLQGTFEGDSPEVTLRVANRSANIVREATFKLAK